MKFSLLIFLSAINAFAIDSTIDPSSQIRALKKLGWKVDISNEATLLTWVEGNPCLRATIEEAYQAGELKVTIPKTIADGPEPNPNLENLLHGLGSFCAFKHKVAKAVVEATSKLSNNEKFEFKKRVSLKFIGLEGNPFWSRPFLGLGYELKTSPKEDVNPSEAIESFYSLPTKSECAVGLQIAEYAMIKETFGNKAFDASFENSEIVIGYWPKAEKSTSIISGNDSGKLYDSSAKICSKTGGVACVGIRGYVHHLGESSELDSPTDRGENFITVSVSPAAAARLAELGGFTYYDKLNKKAFELGRKVADDFKQYIMPGSDLTKVTDQASLSAIKKINAIMSDPVYLDYKVWVHPLGVQTLGWHIANQLVVNPRLPYEIYLYGSTLNNVIFNRYVDHFEKKH